jgi:8-oxo-dGTP diphosphatase
MSAHVILLLYAIRQWQGPALGAAHGHDGQKLAWVKPADLYQWKLLPADIPLIAALQN